MRCTPILPGAIPPKSKPGTHCNACSLKEHCLPVLYQRADPKAYLRAHLDEMQEAAP